MLEEAMQKAAPNYRDSDYSYYRSSPEVIAAIESVTGDDIRDPDGPAWIAWEQNQHQTEVLDLINRRAASHKRGDALYWADAEPWAIHDGTHFNMTKPQPRARPWSPRFTFSHQGREIIFDCPNELAFQRSSHVLTKEPGTIAWIDSFEPRSTFWDVGANIGVFTLYAAVICEATVTAFEPTAQNYMALVRNIVANGLDNRIRALPVAINDQCAVSDMHMRDAEVGSALHVFGSTTDYTGGGFSAHHRQGAIGLPIDVLCEAFGMPGPEYIKVDVDGLERAVIRGAKNTLRTCKSVLVELDLNDTAEVDEITDAMTDAGLRRDDSIPGNIPRQHPGALVYNMIFRR